MTENKVFKFSCFIFGNLLFVAVISYAKKPEIYI